MKVLLLGRLPLVYVAKRQRFVRLCSGFLLTLSALLHGLVITVGGLFAFDVLFYLVSLRFVSIASTSWFAHENLNMSSLSRLEGLDAVGGFATVCCVFRTVLVAAVVALDLELDSAMV